MFGEKTTRHATGVALFLGASLALVTMYTAYFGPFEPFRHRSLALLAAVAIVVLTKPLVSIVNPASKLTVASCWLADAIVFGAVALGVNALLNAMEGIENGLYIYSEGEIWIAFFAMLGLLELGRRVFGWPLFFLGIFAIAYTIFGRHLPGFLRHSGFSLESFVEIAWFGAQGVFGMPTAIMINLILIFIVFGVVLEGTGAGDSLIRISMASTGRLRGGPAHAAILASGMFGTMSGSVTANVVGTGVVTIPMIRSRGFSPPFAGAVEAAASSGGQIMPPVMGAGVFLMAELTGTPYLTLCLAALIPALMYYASLFVSVSLEAKRLDIQPVAPADRVVLNRNDLLDSLMFLLPVAAIIFNLVVGRSPAMAGFWATVLALLMVIAVNKDMRKNPVQLLKTLGKAGIAGSNILVAVGVLGIFLAAINLSGVGLKFALLVQEFSNGGLLVGLVLMMLGCIVLGMGMPTLPAYLIIILVMGPAMKQLGQEPVAVHLFVFYYGVLSAITPPVALAAFAAAPITGASPFMTAWLAMRMAVIGFVVPYMFIFEPEILLIFGFEPLSLVMVLVRLLLVMLLAAQAFIGVDATHLSWPDRALRLALAVTLLVFDSWIGASVALAALGLMAFDRMRAPKQEA